MLDKHLLDSHISGTLTTADVTVVLDTIARLGEPPDSVIMHPLMIVPAVEAGAAQENQTVEEFLAYCPYMSGLYWMHKNGDVCDPV